MKYVAIGDIHGRNDLLQALLKHVGSNWPDHKPLFLGDYVDRGPDSFHVIKTIKDLCDQDKAVAVKGNHEAMMIDYIRNGASVSDHIWMWNGGHKTISSYQRETKQYSRSGFIRGVQQSGHMTWIERLPLFYETDEIWASHAPIPKKSGMAGNYRQDKDACYWTYEPVATMSLEGEGSYNHGKLALCGHIHRLKENYLQPRIYPHIIYADTGCGCAAWGPLTGVLVEDGKYAGHVQVNAEGAVSYKTPLISLLV